MYTLRELTRAGAESRTNPEEYTGAPLDRTAGQLHQTRGGWYIGTGSRSGSNAGELYRESRGNALLTCLPCRLVRYTYARGADRQQRARCPGSFRLTGGGRGHFILAITGIGQGTGIAPKAKKRDFPKNNFKQSVNTRCNRTKSEQREQPEPVKRPGSGRGADKQPKQPSA